VGGKGALHTGPKERGSMKVGRACRRTDWTDDACRRMAAGPAGAATSQVFHMQINQSIPNIDVCGFTVDSVVQGTFTSQDFG